MLSLNGIAQQFADKEYYLVDSLILDELSEGDKNLVDSCLRVYHKANYDTNKIQAIEFLIEECWDTKVWPKYNHWAYGFITEKLNSQPPALIKKKLLTSKAVAINGFGYMSHHEGNISLALEYFFKSVKLLEEIGDKKGMANAYNNIGYILENQGDIPLALEYYHLSLKLKEETNDKKGKAQALNNIGYIHEKQGDIPLALKYYDNSLKIREEIGDKKGMATSYNNLGFIHKNKNNIPLALKYYHKSLKLRKEIGDKKGEAQSYNNIGSSLKIQGNTASALEYYHKSLKIYEEIGNKKGIAVHYNNIGNIQLEQGLLIAAENNGLKSLQLFREIGFPKNIEDAADLLSRVYEKQGKEMQALEMFKLSVTMGDSVKNEVSLKASAQQQAKYEYEKRKAVDDARHDKQLAIEQKEKDKQQILTGVAAGGLGLVVVFLIFVFNRLRVTKKQKLVIEEQKQEVEQQKKVVETAHHELEEKNQEIMDSIIYAKRIQSAILPPNKVVKEYLKESFILYKPKDIVAGDFYWLEQRDDKILFAAADCTGHGVPGAMVSVVCNNGLNRSVREHGLTDPGMILDKTREIVIQEFEKSDEEVKDGMDIALCSLEAYKLQYAGAHNPLWIIRNGEIIETKANKQPIGQFDNPEPYTTHSFELEKGDSIYIFSDGYMDQFGGEKGKKFKARAFRDLLLSIQDRDMDDQKTIIDKAFETWRGNLEQIDDVCVIGVKI